MYTRIYKPLNKNSFFLFGPRGSGKTTWLKQEIKASAVVNLLEAQHYNPLLAQPSKLQSLVAHVKAGEWVVIDEIQKVPALLDEVHNLIESQKICFAMTGSSARKLKRGAANLLAGRALQRRMYPLTATELGSGFDLSRALRLGLLPQVWSKDYAEEFLKTYVSTYLKEEIQAEGLTRNLPAFARFLESVSFSQAQVLSMANVARDAHVDRKAVESYLEILEDLLLAYRIPVFAKKAKRRMSVHPKFYFFDVGVYRAIKPRGPLDSENEIEGPALETLFLTHLKAHIEAHQLEYQIHFWRSADKHEVDFVLYGASGFVAFEIKRSAQVRAEDLRGLREFKNDYPGAKTYFLYGGNRSYDEDGVCFRPYETALKDLPALL